MADLLTDIVNEDEDSMKGRFLTFLIGEETIGVEIKNVMEIVCLQPITEMPGTQDYVKGIVNLRGKIIPVLDVRLRFKMPQAEYDDKTCIIIVELGGMSAGLIVDSVSEVLTIQDEDISEKPELTAGKDGRGYVKSIGKTGEKVVMLLDCAMLLGGGEPEAVSA